MDKHILRILCLASALTDASPVDRAFAVPPAGRLDCCQSAEFSPCQIYPVMVMIMCMAAAALYLSGFQILRGRCLFLSAVAPAHPAGSASFIFRSIQNSQMSEYTACQVFCHISPSCCHLGNTSAVRDGFILKPPRIDQNFFPAVTPAAPDLISVLSPIRFACHCQMPESLSCHIFSFRHFSITFPVSFYTAGGQKSLPL